MNTYSDICRSAHYKLTGHGDRTFAMLLDGFAGVDPGSAADIYGVGQAINSFEDEMAVLLGKPAAIFFPSGTMAQQIGLRIWCDAAGTKRIAYHPLCHLEIHEEGSAKYLHQLEPVLLGDATRLITTEDLAAMDDPVAALLIELPQREIGGQLPSWDALTELVDAARARGMRVHLDGARLFESLPYYGKSAGEVAALFDSVYISFYKGLGAVAGAVLAGPADFMADAKVWKRRHGGDLISLYPYVVPAKHCYDQRAGKMGHYWASAKQVATEMNKIPGVCTVPEVPVCNMFHALFDAPASVVEAIMGRIATELDVAMVGAIREVDEGHARAEFTFGDAIDAIPPELVEAALAQLAEEFGGL